MCLADQWDLLPLPRNPAVLGALENNMTEQDTAKEGQDADMSPRQTAETIPVLPAPVPGVALEPDLQAHIGRQLRAVYEEVVNEAVPDRFLKLLEELERKKAGRS
jgi:hypothetical protein